MPDLLDTRGYVYLKLARYASAVQDYQQALDAGYEYPTVWLGRGLAYAALGQNDKALDDIATLAQPPQVPFTVDPEIQDLVLQARRVRDRLQSNN
jgi:tetratricopeptide (TPR) repeat protein